MSKFISMDDKRKTSEDIPTLDAVDMSTDTLTVLSFRLEFDSNTDDIPSMILGRGEDAQIDLTEYFEQDAVKRVSQKHLEFGQGMVKVLSSARNPTFLNHEYMVPDEAYPLTDAMIIRISGVFIDIKLVPSGSLEGKPFRLVELSGEDAYHENQSVASLVNKFSDDVKTLLNLDILYICLTSLINIYDPEPDYMGVKDEEKLNKRIREMLLKLPAPAREVLENEVETVREMLRDGAAKSSREDQKEIYKEVRDRVYKIERQISRLVAAAKLTPELEAVISQFPPIEFPGQTDTDFSVSFESKDNSE